MALGYDHSLFVLAFDHRGSFKKMLGVGDEATTPQLAFLADAKQLVFEGFLLAVSHGVSPNAAGLLVDEELAARIARTAREMGLRFAMPVERSGQDVFDFEYGDNFAEHVEEFDPTFAKVLVRWNPADGADAKRLQGNRLKTLSDWLHDNDRKLLFELLVPASEEDLSLVNGDAKRYDSEVRPDVTIRSIAEIQAAGIEPDIWKIEGLDRREDCERLVTAIQSEGRHGVAAIVLGRGAERDKVDHWLRQGAPVDGYRGFAIGRSIWAQAVSAFVAGGMSREQAASDIAAAYKRFIDIYMKAQAR